MCDVARIQLLVFSVAGVFFGAFFFIDWVSPLLQTAGYVTVWSHLHNALPLYSKKADLTYSFHPLLVEKKPHTSSFDLSYLECVSSESGVGGAGSMSQYEVSLPLAVRFRRAFGFTAFNGYNLLDAKFSDPLWVVLSSSCAWDEHQVCTNEFMCTFFLFCKSYISCSINTRWSFHPWLTLQHCSACRMWLFHVISFSCIPGCLSKKDQYLSSCSTSKQLPDVVPIIFLWI